MGSEGRGGGGVAESDSDAENILRFHASRLLCILRNGSPFHLVTSCHLVLSRAIRQPLVSIYTGYSSSTRCCTITNKGQKGHTAEIAGTGGGWGWGRRGWVEQLVCVGGLQQRGALGRGQWSGGSHSHYSRLVTGTQRGSRVRSLLITDFVLF